MAACLTLALTPIAIAAPDQAPSLHDLPGTWTDQDGKPFTWDRVKGRTTLVALVYTTCQYACPLITRELEQFLRQLSDKEREQTRVLLFTFDPARDTTTQLKGYAAKKSLDLARWSLLTGPESGARELSVVLGTQYKQLQNGDFAHSNTITVLDGHGHIVHQQQDIGVGRDATLTAIKTAIAGAR